MTMRRRLLHAVILGLGLLVGGHVGIATASNQAAGEVESSARGPAVAQADVVAVVSAQLPQNLLAAAEDDPITCGYDYRPDFACPPPADSTVDGPEPASDCDPADDLGRVLLAFSGLEVERVAPRTTLDDLAGAVCSFGAATTIVMADGTRKAIPEVKVGDYVLAEDPETGERGPRRVTHVWEHEDTVVDLEIDGDLVTATEDHPFWNASDGEWQQAQDLDSGDLVRTADGEHVEVGGLRLRTSRTTTAFNLTVDNIHTYFVGAGEDDVLVHNTCDIPGRPFTGRNAPQRAFDHLEEFHGLDPHVASNRLHVLKQQGGLGAADDVVIGRTGDVYNAQTGERFGSLTDPNLGRSR